MKPDLLLRLTCTFTLSFTLLISSGQNIRLAYVKAAQAYRDAASKTKCPERARHFNAMAIYNDCLAKALETGAKVVCKEPSGTTPACAADAMEGVGSGSGSAAATAGSSKDQKTTQTEPELNNAASASTEAYQNAINSGKKESGAFVDAALSGGQMISDPKTSLAYTGINLGFAGLAFLKERKEAKRLERLEELQQVKEQMKSSATVFDFISGTTDYNVTQLVLEIKKNGRLKNIIRNDKYSIALQIHEVINTTDQIAIYESISFRNHVTLKDSCIISKVVIPLHSLENSRALNGNYTNTYSISSSAYNDYRYKILDNKEIGFAFTMSADLPVLPSGLTDVYIKSQISNIKIYRKFVTRKPYKVSEQDFEGVKGYLSDNYLLVFDEHNDRIKDFVEYLNFVKQ